jgi:biotin operon repressor
MPIYNQIFEHYRNEQARIDKAIKLLKDKGFYIKDLKEDKYHITKNETNRKVYSDSSDKGRS